jgi:preprotein translocase subunit SecG
MILIILIIHVLIAVALVVMVLLQRSEGGALGMGGGGGAGGGLMTGRAAGNLLTRSTGILGATFMVTSIGLAILTGVTSSNRSLFDNPPPAAPVQQEQPAEPAQPTVPLSR